MPLPVLLLVTGRPASGKTTLARELARTLGCPLISRDEIKQGMVRTAPGYRPAPGDALTLRTLDTFFDVLRTLAAAGTATVAEAAFQHHVWQPRLAPLAGLAELRIVRCACDEAVVRERIAGRLDADPHRAAHDDRRSLARLDRGGPRPVWNPITVDAPTLDVDTTDGYLPAFDAVRAFAEAPPAATA